MYRRVWILPVLSFLTVKVFIIYDLCISCVNGRRHAVSRDVCERWKHRLCGTE